MVVHKLVVTTLTGVQGRGEEDDKHTVMANSEKALDNSDDSGCCFGILSAKWGNQQSRYLDSKKKKKKLKSVILKRENIDKHCSNPMLEI